MCKSLKGHVVKVVASLIAAVFCTGFMGVTAHAEGENADSNVVADSNVAADRKYSYNDFIGEWNSDTYLSLYVYKDGSFETVDVGAGNPGIKGTLKVISDEEIEVNCKYDDDFDSYFGIKEKDVLQYHFNEKGQLVVSYSGNKEADLLTFTLDNKKIGKNDISRLKKPKIRNIEAKKGKLYVTLTENEDITITGYEVMYRIAGKKWNTKRVNKYDHQYTVKIRDIKKKKYKIKARVFARLGDNIYYSKWTDVSTYKVKSLY